MSLQQGRASIRRNQIVRLLRGRDILAVQVLQTMALIDDDVFELRASKGASPELTPKGGDKLNKQQFCSSELGR